MKTAIVTVEGVTPFSPSRPFESVKGERESSEAFDERCWPEHCHLNSDGLAIVPSMMIQFSICSGAERLKKKIKGEGLAKYGALFASGVLVPDDMLIDPGVHLKDVKSQRFYCHADGKRVGGGTRVWRRFPMFYEWRGTFPVHVLDDKITELVFEEAMESTGRFIGWGRFRVANKGRNGRFDVKKIAWS